MIGLATCQGVGRALLCEQTADVGVVQIRACGKIEQDTTGAKINRMFAPRPFAAC
jgi:hypothetical protein